MTKRTIVYWSSRRLAHEYGLSPINVGRLLSKLGAKRLSYSGKSKNQIWYWDSNET